MLSFSLPAAVTFSLSASSSRCCNRRGDFPSLLLVAFSALYFALYTLLGTTRSTFLALCLVYPALSLLVLKISLSLLVFSFSALFALPIFLQVHDSTSSFFLPRHSVFSLLPRTEGDFGSPQPLLPPCVNSLCQ